MINLLMKVYITSYAEGEDYINNMNTLHNKAILYGGVDCSIKYTLNDLKKTGFYQKNKKHFDEQPNNGFWCWKPYVILETLKKVKNGDYVIYHDGGKSNYKYNILCFNENINSLCKIVDDNFNGFFLGFYSNNNNIEWCKYDCFKMMNCDKIEYLLSKQLNSTIIIIKKGSKKINKFLNEWLTNCLDFNKISNNTISNYKYPSFNDHRHDQSILTNLVIKNNIILPDLSKYKKIKYKQFTIDECRRYYPTFEKCIMDKYEEEKIKCEISINVSKNHIINFAKKYNISNNIFKNNVDKFCINNSDNSKQIDYTIRIDYPFDIKIPDNTKFLFVVFDKELIDDNNATINNLMEFNNYYDRLYFIINNNYLSDIKKFINRMNIKFNNFITYGKNKNFKMVIEEITKNIIKPYKLYNKLNETNNLIELKDILINMEKYKNAKFIDSDLHKNINTLYKIECIKYKYGYVPYKMNFGNPLGFIIDWENNFIKYLKMLETSHKNYSSQFNLIVGDFFDNISVYFLNEKFAKKIYNFLDKNIDYLINVIPFYTTSLYTKILNLDYKLGKKYREKINKKIQKLWSKHNLNINLEENNKMALIFKQDEFYKNNAIFKFIKNQIIKLSEKHELELYLTEFNENFDYIISTNPIKHLIKKITKLDIKYHNLTNFSKNSCPKEYIYETFPGLEQLINGNYGKIYYITIGMDITQLYLSNLQIAPIQLSGYSHLYSSFGSKINKFICSKEIEYDNKEECELDYSEDIIWMEGYTSKPSLQENFNDSLLDYKKSNNKFINIGINSKICKMNYNFINILKKIGDNFPQVIFSFFVGNKYNEYIISIKLILNQFNIKHYLYFMGDTYKEYIHKKLKMDFFIDSNCYGGFTTNIENINLNKPVIVSDKGNTTSLKMARYISRKYNQSQYIGDIYEKSSELIKKLLLEKTNKKILINSVVKQQNC